MYNACLHSSTNVNEQIYSVSDSDINVCMFTKYTFVGYYIKNAGLYAGQHNPSGTISLVEGVLVSCKI